jgi:hypothetical protein
LEENEVAENSFVVIMLSKVVMMTMMLFLWLDCLFSFIFKHDFKYLNLRSLVFELIEFGKLEPKDS